MNLVIPAAGLGSRFVHRGYPVPKPFIPIKGRTMLERVIDNLAEPGDRIFILTRLGHLEHLRGTSLICRDDVAFIPVEQPTEGAACTVLRARQFIASREALLIANSDQWVRYDREAWRALIRRAQAAMMTFWSDEPKWSYARPDACGRVVEVAEKRVISPHATVGVYYFAHGEDFVGAADRMIARDARVNGEFYVCPVFNELVERIRVDIFPVDAMFGLGTPEDLQAHYDEVGA